MSGFTLVELLIVMGITVILGVVGFANYRGYRAERIFTRDVQLIVATLRQTQSRAIAQEAEEQWGVHFEHPASGTSFHQVFNGTWATGEKGPRTNIRVTLVAPASSSTIDVIFAKQTGLPTASTTISLSLRGVQKDIIVNEQGNIKQQ